MGVLDEQVEKIKGKSVHNNESYERIMDCVVFHNNLLSDLYGPE